VRRIVSAEELCGTAGLTIGLSGLIAGLEVLADLGVLLCFLMPVLSVLGAATAEDRQDGMEALAAMWVVAFGGYLLGEAADWPLAAPSAVLAGCALHVVFAFLARTRERGTRSARPPAILRSVLAL
jgi:hypothetical protein